MSRSADNERRDRAYNIQRAEDAREKISYRKRASELGAVKIWSGKSADSCSPLEQDFTTPGTPGRLGCPFAPNMRPRSSGSNIGVSTPRSSISRVSLGRRSKRASFHDPIRAESCVNNVAKDPSVEGSVPLCPIRFLDQHSPEEVAKYFENHKHELPRSHEFCVKRFQENDLALQNLDSKYANMVTMVKELGKVHGPMLPDAEDIEAEEGEEQVQNNSSAKVEDWANAVHTDEVHDDDDDGSPPDLEEDRQSRFDRSLKDIRVGESPSRPWGIIVPEQFRPDDAASKRSDPTASPLEHTTGPGDTRETPAPGDDSAPRCPFSRLAGNTQAMPKDHPVRAEQREPDPPSTTKAAQSSDGIPKQFDKPTENSRPQMIFNGPVFIGYPVDQAMNFMRQFSGTQAGNFA